MDYQVQAIEPAVLEQLRAQDDAGREPLIRTDTDGGLPLRCCLSPSAPGDEVALLSYAPLRRWAADSGADPGPYEEVGPIFIHAHPCPGAGPDYPLALHGRRRIFRAYDHNGWIRGGLLVERDGHEAALKELFDDPETAIVHVRAVEYGCFTFAILRP